MEKKNKFIKIIFLTLVLAGLFCVFSANHVRAAAFNDAVDGNWNSGATWGNPGNDVQGSGYPGPSDSAAIDSHNVTLTTTQSVSSINISNGSFNGQSNTLTIGTTFTQSGGTFTAPGGMNIVNTFNRTGGTFNHNDGTVTFLVHHSTYSVTTNNATFYNVVINKTAGGTNTLTFQDSFTISHNLTVKHEYAENYYLYIRGNGTPTITVAGDMDFPNAVGNKIEFGEDNAATNFTVNLAGNFTLSDSNVTVFVNITLNGAGDQNLSQVSGSLITYGTWTGNNNLSVPTQLTNLTIGGALTITQGTFYTNGNNLTVSGVFSNNDTLRVDGGETLTFSGTGGFDEDSGTVEFVGAGTYAGLPNGFGDAFFNTTFNGTGEWQLDANMAIDGALDINQGTLFLNSYAINDGAGGATPTLTNIAGTLKLRGSATETVFWTTNDTDSGTWLYVGDGDGNPDTYTVKDFGTNDYYNLTINSTDSTTDAFQLGANLKVLGTITNSAGTFDVSASNYTINVAGNWSNPGTFVQRSGAVTLDGTGQKIFGDTTFYNLTKDVSAGAADSLFFQQSNTQSIAANGILTLKGASGKILTLRGCDSSGNETSGDPKWGLTVNNTGTTVNVDYVNAKDSDASNGKAIAQTNSIDSGNNLNWLFDETPPVQSNHNPASGSTITNPAPIITFTLDENGDCYASVDGDESYDQMSDDVNCTGDGGTSITCEIDDLGSDGSKTIYIACQDTAYGNKDSSGTNTEIIYTLERASGGGPSGGGGFHLGCDSQNQCVIMVGSGPDQCSTYEDCATHNVCNSEKQCVSVKGLGENQCQLNSDCITEHNECNTQNQCVIVLGSGIDHCQTDADCQPARHNKCNSQRQCISVEGAGLNQCQADSDCYISHNECSQNNQCVEIFGPGLNQCIYDQDCYTPKHNECNLNKRCIVVGGAGPDKCQTDSDCITEEPPLIFYSHYECNEQNQCVSVSGLAADRCQEDADCESSEVIIEEEQFPLPDETSAQAISQTLIGLTKKVINSPQGSVATKIVSTVGLASGVAVVASAVVFAPTSIFEMFLIPMRLIGLLMTAFGLKKRILPWGVVYDSVTKQPIDPAYVILKNSKGKEISSVTTDIDGRYGFLAGPGTYQIVANKTNYVFPSQKLLGKVRDELYADLYFGEKINVKDSGQAIIKNIPLDPVKFDWNEFAKKDKRLMMFYSKWNIIIRKISDFVFAIGFIVALIAFFAAPYPYNTIIAALYLFILLLRVLGLKPKQLGSIVEKAGGAPLSFAIIRIMSPGSDIEIGHRIADKYGRYYCLVPKGKYYIKIEQKNEDESYSLVYASQVIDASKTGIIKEKFRV